jgi:hypothetical protein
MFFLFAVIELFMISNFSIIWKNDVIIMDLNDNVNDYKYLPEAELWINGQLVTDPMMFYERGVEHTFFSVITGKTVRDYHIKYRVHFPSYQIVETKTIVFKVVDRVPPTIHHVPSFVIPVGSKMPNLTEGLVYSDNYNKNSELTVNVISHQVVLNKIGIYPIHYKVSDQSGNLTEATSYLEVYDHLPPEITLKKEIIISFGKPFKWSDFLTFKDNYDVLIDKIYDESEVDYNRLGQYPLKVTATDQSGLSSVLMTTITIIDDEPPRIVLKSNPKPLSVYQDLSVNDLKDYIVSIHDNYDTLSIEDVIITHDIEIDTLGQYMVYFELYDLSRNVTKVSLRVHVRDLEVPTVRLYEPLIFEVFDLYPHWSNYVEIKDNYDAYHQLQIKYTTQLNMTRVGIYSLTIEVTDTSKNKTVFVTSVEIVDQIAPVIEQMHEIVITDFTKKPLNGYFQVFDNYDKSSDVSLIIDDSNVNYAKVGVYALTIEATDQSQNKSFFESEVFVIDIVPPTLILKQKQVFFKKGTSHWNPFAYILAAYDNHDLLTKEDVLIEDFVNLNEIGVYEVFYTLNDYSYNETMVILYVYVDISEPPIVESHVLTVFVNEFVDLLNGLIVFVETENYEVIFFPKVVDTSNPGKKIVQGVVVDERGNFTHFEREIIVLEQSKTIQLERYFPLAITNILGLTMIYYIWQKKRKS